MTFIYTHTYMTLWISIVFSLILRFVPMFREYSSLILQTTPEDILSTDTCKSIENIGL